MCGMLSVWSRTPAYCLLLLVVTKENQFGQYRHVGSIELCIDLIESV
jgi:hypothetical protein